jgi:membrane protein YdbS with pleckstrin-like domain
VKKRSAFSNLTFLFGVPLVILLALAAGIKEFYRIALFFIVVCFVYMFALFVSTFFLRAPLRLRELNYKKHELN